VRLPERIEGHGLLLRRWLVGDARAMEQAIAESAEHLRPWMAWMAESPQTLKQRGAMLREWEREWLEGGDVLLAIFVDGRVAGSCGLHRRRGPDVLEIGYWIHVSFLRRGLATTVARMLTDAAFSVPDIHRTEIHHDKANTSSAAIPRRLGYEFAGEQSDEKAAPAELGIDCAWTMRRELWLREHEYRPRQGSVTESASASTLPEPTADGAADHLRGSRLPAIELPATDGRRVRLDELSGRLVVFVYPGIGGPARDDLLDEWTAIPGARGCTPEACGIRDQFAQFTRASVEVFGLSTQSPSSQAEHVRELALPYPLLSDQEFRFDVALGLPAFDFHGRRYLKRLTLIAENGTIETALYPIFPPHDAAAHALRWLTQHPRGS
jgi:peroxiredoxin (alkyl hydroperoxide reductase subunit C)